MSLFRQSTIFNWHGVRLTETTHAMVDPKGTPHTDDMRDMVEHMRQLGLIQKKPGAFQMGDDMFVHPKIMSSLRERLRLDVDRMIERDFFKGHGLK